MEAQEILIRKTADALATEDTGESSVPTGSDSSESLLQAEMPATPPLPAVKVDTNATVPPLHGDSDSGEI